VVLRGDLNNITIGQVSNIQDRTVIHAARCAAGGTDATGATDFVRGTLLPKV
jgi:carbonic anhydrase/acetyltransferase-like protein (isoleucine patch superfamily)